MKITRQTKIAIEQDLYLTIYLSNIVELAKKQSDNLINEKTDQSDLKHEYQINTNVMIGRLKDEFVLMMLKKNLKKRHKIYIKIMDEISRSTVPIRPSRSNVRIPRKIKINLKLIINDVCKLLYLRLMTLTGYPWFW